MDINNLIKPLVLNGTRVTIDILLQQTLNYEIFKRFPQITLWQFEEDKRERFLAFARFLGITLTIAMISAAVANKSSDLVESIFWSENQPSDPE